MPQSGKNTVDSDAHLSEAPPYDPLNLIFQQITNRAELVITLTTYALRVLLLDDDKLLPNIDLDEIMIKQYLRDLIAGNGSQSRTQSIKFKLTPIHMEQTVSEWAFLIPQDRNTRIALLNKLIHTFKLPYKQSSAIRRAFDEETLAPIYEEHYGVSLVDDFKYELPMQSVLSSGAALKLQALREKLQWHAVPNNTPIFTEGEPSTDGLYILVSGRASVSVNQNGQEIPVAWLGQGQIIGEIGLLSDAPRSATVKTTRDSVLVHLSEEDFTTISRLYPEVTLALTRRIISRFQQTSPNPVNLPRTILIKQLAVPHDDIIPRLIAMLEPFGKVLHLNKENFDAIAFSGALSMLPDEQNRVLPISWMNEQEASYRFILYEVDDTDSPWTHQCVAQSDMALLIAEVDADPSQYPIEALLPVDMDTELILLRTNNQSSQIAKPWLVNRKLRRHYNVDLNRPDTLARVVRFLTGNAVGLVFGGGGARGFAHLGVVQALQEKGIPIDFVGGASAGAILAGFVASEYPVEEGLMHGQKLFSNFVDYTLPLISLASGKKLTNGLRALFGDTQIEDLFIKFFSVSTNTSTSTLYVHHDGDLATATRASASIPGIFPPIIADNETRDVLVDGGVMNNVPVDIMTRTGVGYIIAIDLGGDAKPRKSKFNNPPGVSGFDVIADRFNPLRRKQIKAPSFAGMLFRVLMMNDESDRQRLRQQADLYLLPPLNNFNIFDTSKASEIMHVGYESAVAELPALNIDDRILLTPSLV